MLCLENLEIRLGAFELRGVRLEIEEGEYFVLLGASGVGKTVLLECISGLQTPAGGSVLLDGREINGWSIQERPFSLVYQDQALFPHLPVRRNVAYGMKERGAERRARVKELARETGIEHLLDRHPPSLSGGEAQRVALARALATKPRFLLLDEPISALDISARAGMRSLLRRLHRGGLTVIHVTHDYEEALALATRVGILEHGVIAQSGTPGEIFSNPRSEFSARFAGIRNVLAGRLEGQNGSGRAVGCFNAGGTSFAVLTEELGGSGYLMFRSEDVQISLTRPQTSARNCFQGRVVDLAPTRLGFEVGVDIGVEITALLSETSVRELDIRPGKEVWTSLKASAARFYGGGA